MATKVSNNKNVGQKKVFHNNQINKRTSIGNSRNSKPLHKNCTKKPYRGQG